MTVRVIRAWGRKVPCEQHLSMGQLVLSDRAPVRHRVPGSRIVGACSRAGTYHSSRGRISAAMSPTESHEACSSLLKEKPRRKRTSNRFGSFTDMCT
ncbi:hypothetical protein chiPu_0001281 [Chiloscyllium punctatum]|uniref:Uncharacterized protein n=1 Tax=Chiloscyllium punctatum TaxID=137246 RepID=A0A401RXK8_CHIPU|nr:hypothetical protein [Chiloscyllium punctatum]